MNNTEFKLENSPLYQRLTIKEEYVRIDEDGEIIIDIMDSFALDESSMKVVDGKVIYDKEIICGGMVWGYDCYYRSQVGKGEPQLLLIITDGMWTSNKQARIIPAKYFDIVTKVVTQVVSYETKPIM